MENNGNEQIVRQGENWNLDKVLSASNREYIPYIISSERVNPFFVVTVASTKFEKNLRYVKSWWNSVDDLNIPTFYQTTPVDYGEISGSSRIPQTATSLGDTKDRRYLYRYTLTTDTIDPALGHKPYYYFYYDFSTSDEGQLVLGYECKITFNFPSEVTSEWSSQNYLYQITLVSGQLMEDRLNAIYIAKGAPADWPDTIEAQYKYVKVQWPNELQADIDIDSPLGYIDIPEPILQPTALRVNNNLRTLI
jgi:hypothetical protein